MAQRSSLRASDADRDRIAERLRRATAEGRLHAHELEVRLAAALRARTYGELDAVVADLPRDQVARRPGSDATRWVRPALGMAVAIPVALVAVALVVAVVVFVLSGVFAIWMVWMALGWWFFGRHRYHHSRARVGPGWRH
jgi:hypothetical protein